MGCGRVGDAPETLLLIEAPPILLALIELSPERALRLLWREDTPKDARISVCWTGRDWQSMARDDCSVALQDAEEPTALRVREMVLRESGSSPSSIRLGAYAGSLRASPRTPMLLAALLDFPIRPAEATDDDDGSPMVMDGTRAPAAGLGSGIEGQKSYALHAAAELIEKVAALQFELPASMLDDWLDHLDRMFRGSFPEVLVSTWREHRIDMFSHLRKPELRPPQLTEKQRARYFEVLDDAARLWGLR